jgi:hypothetical protein
MTLVTKKLSLTLAPLLLLLTSAQIASGWYDPGLQRWINRDPVMEEGGINVYSFVGNSPGGQIDPAGLGLLDPGGPIPTEIALLCACRSMIREKTRGAEDWANSNYGGPGLMHSDEGSIADMLTHCVASCELARNEGICLAARYDVRGRWQAREGNHTRGGDKMDYENNRIGFAIADAGMDCRQGCLQAFTEGWLWTVSKVPPYKAHPVGHPPVTNPRPPRP